MIVTFIGSANKTHEMMEELFWKYANKGDLVLMPNYFGGEYPFDRAVLNDQHYKKIDIADLVVCCVCDNYLGESTSAELNYALQKRIKCVIERSESVKEVE